MGFLSLSMETTDAIAQLETLSRGRRVALVHDWLRAMRGGEKVLEHLCALFPGADVYTLLYEPDKVSPAIRAMNVREHSFFRRFPAARAHYQKLLPIMPRLVRDFPTADYDLVISTSHCVAKGAPSPRRGLHFSYVFTPMRYVWDHFEDYLSGKPIPDLALRAARPRLQRWDRDSAREIDHIAADSGHIAHKIERHWRRSATVIPPPVDLDVFTPAGGEPRADYWLVVGALVPYKHIERAIAATRETGDQLVIIGDGPQREFLEGIAHRGVTFRGWVSRDELVDAYRHCRALIYPGIEDFGIAALEAMACGRPVIGLRGGGVSETVRERITGQFFEEPTHEDLAVELTGFQPGDYDCSRIRARAEEFSPDRFRRELAEWILGPLRHPSTGFTE